MCGETVNEKIPVAGCSELVHAERRRHRDKYCLGCGTQLRKRARLRLQLDDVCHDWKS